MQTGVLDWNIRSNDEGRETVASLSVMHNEAKLL